MILFLSIGLVLSLTVDASALNVSGLVPSVFTPFDSSGRLNVSVIPQYAEYLKNNHVSGVLVAGTASEGPSLSLIERKALLDAWVKEARPLGLKVVMQVGGLPLPEVLELTKYSETVRPDALLTLPELYYKPSNVEALVRYVKLVSEAAPSLPMLYYDHPSLSGVKLNMAKFFKLATESIPNFKGIKCNFVTAVEIITINDLRDDQHIYMASHATMSSAYATGFNSTMSTISNLFPCMLLNIQRSVQQKDGKANELQRELNKRVVDLTEQGEYVPFVKAAMGIMSGIDLGNTRDPIVQVTKDQRKIIEDRVKKFCDKTCNC